ncbi:MAG: ABC transporter ATP-binding protein [Anaerolineae bacterium]|nr:ABC transporter ATP-binding protein [Gemmatimonadaceae bacterium]
MNDPKAPMILMRRIEKSFGPVRANRNASLEVCAGEIHALVGENGAGKSTLMRILAGLYKPDAGIVEVNGQNVAGWSTADAIAANVGMVHQHFMLVPTLTVTENVVLGREPKRGLAIDMARALLEVQELAQQFGLDIDARSCVRDLSVGVSQRVEILKTLFRGARILILDEPTAVLSPPEIQELWKVLRRLRDGGGTIILITHKLDEVMEVSDQITVMRHGETTSRMKTSETTPAEIARAMVGRDVVLESIAPTPPAGELGTAAPRAPLLEVQNLVVAGPNRSRAVDGVTFSIHPGEILGIAGVEGNGQTELIEALAGLRSVSSGTIILGSRDVTLTSVRERSAAGLAHIPEDRQRRGLVLDYSVGDNLILGDQHEFTRGAQLDRQRIASNANTKIQHFDVRPADSMLPVRALSGGNQQKVVIAREMSGGFSVLLASQPTRGVDVGAIEFIHAQLREARTQDKAVLLVSAELSEILALSDRVAVMYGGRIVSIVPRADASKEFLGPLMTGASAA